MKGVIKMKKSFFGDMFDFDDNGELDEVEQAAEFLYLESFMDEEDDEEDDDDDLDDLDFDDDPEEDDSDDEDWEDTDY